jgi:hypothetical protein
VRTGNDEGMTVTYLDPRAQPSAPVEPYAAKSAWDTSSPGPLVVGLLANGFPDSVAFLHLVEASLLTRLPASTTTTFLNKGNASAPATEAQVNTMAAEVHVVVTAYGH